MSLFDELDENAAIKRLTTAMKKTKAIVRWSIQMSRRVRAFCLAESALFASAVTSSGGCD